MSLASKQTLRGLQNPGNCCYMNSAVQGLLWGAIKVGPLQAHQWKVLPEIFEHIVSNDDGEPVLLWGNGKWLSLMDQWARPFAQHDLVEYLQFLLPIVEPCFLSNLWEARIEADGVVRTVDSGAHFCPVRLYLSAAENEDTTKLQELFSAWSLESYGLQAFAGPADLLTVQIDRFNRDGGKCTHKLSWNHPVFVPHFVHFSMEIDNIPYTVVAVSHHVGHDPHSGHYQTALWDETHWVLLDDAAPPVHVTRLPDDVLRNCCVLWLKLTDHGGAQICDVIDSGSLAILTKEQQMLHVKQAFSQDHALFDAWLPALDRLDVRLLLDSLEACGLLTRRCVLCNMQPPDLKSHLRLHHAALWDEAEQPCEELTFQFMTQARPGRLCACQPFYSGMESMDEHICPCFRNFGMLHRFLKRMQQDVAIETTAALALQIAQSFS